MSAILPPAQRVWWKQPVHGVELVWIIIAFVWCMVMFFMMVYWHVYGRQNLSTETYKTTPEKFSAKTQAMVDKYKVRDESDAEKTPVVRPPADAKAIPLDRKKLEYIKRVFGESAEIIAASPIREKQHHQVPLSAAVLEMARRRPVTVEDVAGALDAPLYEVNETVKALVNKGDLRRQTHIGKDYYTG